MLFKCVLLMSSFFVLDTNKKSDIPSRVLNFKKYFLYILEKKTFPNDLGLQEFRACFFSLQHDIQAGFL